MNLIGLSFFWQGLGRGIVLLAILLLGVLLARYSGRPGPFGRLFTLTAAPRQKAD